ncbi:MAG: tyrosine--tRNA ligase [Alphaproteobacteria bacterium]|nr:tyrosine--tRNA ligase [Alphaproteobacteria bacterium]
MAGNFFETLKSRGFVYQMTNEDRIKAMIDSDKPLTFYLGIDPTADSLHIGHFFALRMFKMLQDRGHKGILLIGGATAMVGDPSGKSDLRQMLTQDDINHNLKEIKDLAGRFIKTTGDNAAIIVNNADWINKFSYIEFMRYVGIHFNVNKMLAMEAYASRLESGGLTFLEMGYMLMQAYDFVHLNREYGCILQIGGSDQWGNIVAGTELSRKMNFHVEGKASEDRPEIMGMTCPLLMTKDGRKMGKTEAGTLWVAREKTTPFDFYQYFYNVPDECTDILLKVFTSITVDKIDKMCKEDIVAAKKTMAFELTKLVHGEDEANKVLDAASGLFGTGESLSEAPTKEIKESVLEAGISVVDLAVSVGFLPSKAEARRMIEQNGLAVNGIKVESADSMLGKKDLIDGALLLQKGKKTFLRLKAV